MAHIREVRPAALELKFLLDPATAIKVARWARANLDRDPNGGGPSGDEYITNSLYLDTDDFDVFNRRGSYGRSKYRIRRYGSENAVFLERKMRQPAVLAKRRTRLGVDELASLAAPSLDPEWPGYWFHRRVSARRLRPVCQVSYSRMARALLRNGEQIRLTLDYNLCAQPATEARFGPVAGTEVLPDRLILELKYQGTSPAIFRHLVEEFALTPQSASKYRLGLAALGARLPVSPASPTTGEAFYA